MIDNPNNPRREALAKRERKREAGRARERQEYATATTVAVVETIRQVEAPFRVVRALTYDPRTDELRGAA